MRKAPNAKRDMTEHIAEICGFNYDFERRKHCVGFFDNDQLRVIERLLEQGGEDNENHRISSSRKAA